MDRHRGVQVGLLIGGPLVSGLLIGTLALTTRVTWSIRESVAMLVGLSGLVVSVLAVVIGNWRSTVAFRSLRCREEELAQQRRELIQNVNHELRHPLTLVRGYVELLNEQQLDEDQRRRLADLALQGTVNLVERVEAVSACRTDVRAELNSKPVDLMDLTATALRMVWQKAHRRDVALRLDGPTEPVRVLGDPFWLLEALELLVCSAIESCSGGRTLSVRLSEKADEVCLEIFDEGASIPAGQSRESALPFWQVDGSVSRRRAGSSAELATVQEVAKAHQGRVWVSSEGQDRGSALFLVLPAHRHRPATRRRGRVPSAG